MMGIRKRFPEFQSILQVYAVSAVMFAGWTITSFLWKLSAWLLLLNLGELFTVFSYAMVANFVESLTVLGLVLMICVLLPADAGRDDFIVRGTLLSLGIIGALMAFVGSHMQFGIDAGFRLLLAPLLVLIVTSALLVVSVNSQLVRSAAAWLSDRLTVFLFLLLPLFAVLSVFVIFRNLVGST